MSLSWRFDPPQGWEVRDTDYGLRWAPECSTVLEEEIDLEVLPRGIDGYEQAMSQVKKVEAANDGR